MASHCISNQCLNSDPSVWQHLYLVYIMDANAQGCSLTPLALKHDIFGVVILTSVTVIAALQQW